jgi:hypothetical protein
VLLDTAAVIETIRIDTDADQDRKIIEFIRQRMVSPGFYTLGGRNCSKFVSDALNAGGFPTIGSRFPKKLMDGIEQRYGGVPTGSLP